MRSFLPGTILLGVCLSMRIASAQALACATSVSVIPAVRAEGTTELIGDIVLVCSGGTPTTMLSEIPKVNLTIFLNTAVTTKLKTLQAAPASEALLLIDEPNSGIVGRSSTLLACGSATGCSIAGTGNGTGTYSGVAGRPNIFQGVVSGNSITFFGVPVDAPGTAPATARVLRFTGIRVNASAVAPSAGGGPSTILASISISGATSVQLSNPVLTVAFVQPGIAYSVRDGGNAAVLNESTSLGSGSIPGPTPAAHLRFAENFGTAAKTRTSAAFAGTETSPVPATQNVPGTIYNSESGLTFTVPSITVSPADHGTRFKATFGNLPAGASVWAGLLNTGASAQKTARLIVSESGAFFPASPSTIAGGFSIAQLPKVNGKSIAVWEVLGANSNANDTFDFPIWVTGGSVNVGAMDGSLAPNPTDGAFIPTLGTAASLSLPVPRFADPFTPGVSRVISQMVDGGAWKTTIVLVNTGATRANFTLRFWDEQGVARSLPFVQDGLRAQISGSIGPGGSRTIETEGLADQLTVVWAELVSLNSLGGFAVFRQRVEGRPDQEAAVPLESVSGRFVLPFDNTQGSVTAMALVNTSQSQTANLMAAFRSEDGRAAADTTFSLSPLEHRAFAFTDLVSAISSRRGVAEFSSAGPNLTALGLRFIAGGAFTSFPMLSFQDTSLNAPSRVVSQVADGGGWKTSFVLANMDTEPVVATLRFWKDDGSAFRLLFEGAIGGASETFVGTIPVGGSLTLTTRGVNADVSQGWAELSTNSKKVGGVAVFRQSVLGRTDQEAAVPLATSLSRFVLPFDNTQGFVTAMALINSNATQAVSIAVVVRDETGLQIATDSLIAGPRAHTAFALPDRFPLLANKRGTLEFSSSGADLSGLGLRFNPGGAFTSFPVFPK